MEASKASISLAGNLCYAISGELDFESVPPLMRELNVLLKNSESATISFAGVTKSNSASLALLLEVARVMRGKTIQFTQISSQMSVFAQAYGVSQELRGLGLTD